MSHPFGDLVTQHLSRRHGLSQNKLAAGICQDPAVISAMCNGRRLSGRQARERVLAILGWLHARAVLSTRAEADALLEAAKLSRLDPGEPAEAELLALLEKPTPAHPGDPPAAGAVPARSGPRRSPMPLPRLTLALTVLGMLAIAGAILLLWRPSRVTLWEENFAPLHPDQWQDAYASAAWEDLPGPGAVLRENHPLQGYGKAESAPIVLDADRRPVLRVSVRAVEPGASYTIQILDKVRDTSVDVLHELSLPGEHAIDLVQAMGWQGPQVCTINVWVGGASRAVTFERIAVEVDRTQVR